MDSFNNIFRSAPEDLQPTEHEDNSEVTTSDAVDNTPSEYVDESGEVDPNAFDKIAAEDDVVDEPTEEVKAPEPEAPAKRKYKLKINDEEVEQEFDDDEIARRLQKEMVADQRFNEAAKLRQDVNQVMQLLKANPAHAMQQLGIDPDQFAESWLGSRLEEQLLTPEQRAAKQEREELENYRKMVRQHQEEQQKLQNTQLQQEAHQRIQTDLVEAMASIPGLPDLPATRHQLMIEGMQIYAADKARAIKMGTNPTLTPKRAIEKALHFQQQRLNMFIKDWDPDKLAEWLGEDALNRLRKRDLDKRAKFPANKSSAGTTPQRKGNEQKRPQTEKELEAYLKELAKRK